ncbi:MAG: bifunctional adenosylcobinamide kinase/adenosylcobinamide-phosphate guanylyltransferase [Proteobacteria bacterium]|nr:bifunctional adenosylcobinamide kinase/adenosylcobinamide-phosphate guanylyltransferase [Pseudomonadota bacterium]
MPEKTLTLVTGGIKSGKSAWAQQQAERLSGTRAFVATALPLDDEMKTRIRRHREARGDAWVTFEKPKDLVPLLDDISGRFDIILVDCLTIWLSNLLTMYGMDEEAAARQIAGLSACFNRVSSRVFVISNETGMGIIPADPLSRLYQRLLGSLNSEVAAAADEVYLMVSGIAVNIKPSR